MQKLGDVAEVAVTESSNLLTRILRYMKDKKEVKEISSETYPGRFSDNVQVVVLLDTFAHHNVAHRRNHFLGSFIS